MLSSLVAARQKWLLPLPVTPITATSISPSPGPAFEDLALAGFGAGFGRGLYLVLDTGCIGRRSPLAAFGLGLGVVEDPALANFGLIGEVP